MIQSQECSLVETLTEEASMIFCHRTDTLMHTTIHTSMMIQVEKSVHHQITGYYNTKYFEFTYDESVRDWLSGQTFESQTEFGVKVLKGFGVIE